MDILDHIANEKRPIDQATREALLDAVRRVAAEHDGLVHVSWLREELPEWVSKAQSCGTFTTALVRAKVLVWTGEYAPSGNYAQRNGERAAKVYRFHPEAVTA